VICGIQADRKDRQIPTDRNRQNADKAGRIIQCAQCARAQVPTTHHIVGPTTRQTWKLSLS